LWATPAKAGGHPESRNFKYPWILAFAGMTGIEAKGYRKNPPL
jgi:hypothetical protein